MAQVRRPRKATSAPKTVVAEVETKPEDVEPSLPAEETSEQKRIRELEERLANLDRLLAEKESAESEASATPVDKEGDTVIIHFVEDGFTAQGKSWYRGQELEFVVGSASWNDTCDRTGVSWVSATEDEQIERRGKVYFRRGPWKGKTYKDATWDKKEEAPPESELERADRLERERHRAVPRLPDLSDE